MGTESYPILCPLGAEPAEGRSKWLQGARAQEVSTAVAVRTARIRKAKVASKKVDTACPTPRPACPSLDDSTKFPAP